MPVFPHKHGAPTDNITSSVSIPDILQRLSNAGYTLVGQSSSGPYKPVSGITEDTLGYHITTYTLQKSISEELIGLYVYFNLHTHILLLKICALDLQIPFGIDCVHKCSYVS